MRFFRSHRLIDTEVADEDFIQEEYWRITKVILAGLGQLKFLGTEDPSFVPIGKTRDEALLEIAGLMRWHVLILDTYNFDGWTRNEIRILISKSIKIVEKFTINEYQNILGLYKHLNSILNPGMRFVSEDFLKKLELNPNDPTLNYVLESMEEVFFLAQFNAKHHQLGVSIYADHVQANLKNQLEEIRKKSF